MTENHIDLPPVLLQFAESQVATGRYSDVADYVRSILRDEMARRGRLIDELQRGIDSGDSDCSFDEAWQAGVEKAQSRAA